MIKRDLQDFLYKWKSSPSRLPLILRGARQVGKTTLIKAFGKEYDQFLYFNLENTQDANLVKSANGDVKALVQLMFLTREAKLSSKVETLIFIDEIQEVPSTIEALRYFHEDFPEIHVIVTGSMLEFALKMQLNMPVGRVEFAELGPLSFHEYLVAIGKRDLIQAMNSIPLSQPLSQPIIDLVQGHFHTFGMIGGMPGIVSHYIETEDLTRTKELFYAITEAYKSDIQKYANTNAEAAIIRDVLDVAHGEIDNRVNLSKFGKLAYKSTDIKNSLQKLELARWLYLKYPTTNTELPIVNDKQKMPRLHFLDIGLINYQLGIIDQYLTITDLSDLFRGKIIQQMVCQELQSLSYLGRMPSTFWVREQKGTTSEVDIVMQYKQYVIPIEIKSGATGRLRSLQEFIDRCPHDIGVRLYNGPIVINHLETRTNKKYRLLNLPYCLASQIPKYLDWMVGQDQ